MMVLALSASVFAPSTFVPAAPRDPAACNVYQNKVTHYEYTECGKTECTTRRYTLREYLEVCVGADGTETYRSFSRRF